MYYRIVNKDSIYNSGYEFVRKRTEQKDKVLKIITIALPLIVIFTLLVGFITSMDIFKSKTEDVTKVFKNDPTPSVDPTIQIQQYLDSYKQAGIPYEDPNGRFRIDFATPYPSDQIALVINTPKDYDKTVTDAQAVIVQIQKKINVKTVTYFKRY